MDTRVAYFDESGDDGLNTKSSKSFILTSLYMPCSSWQNNYNIIKLMRNTLKTNYGFHIKQEMHTKNFLSNKSPYRDYKWSNDQKIQILNTYIETITQLNISIINVIIDKTKIRSSQYGVLKNALTYNIQRIENDSSGDWNYFLVTDKGRIAPMRKTARAIQVFNPIHSMFNSEYNNQPIKYMFEDIFEKDSKESFFIQMSDFVSCFVHLYYKSRLNESFPNRIMQLIDEAFVLKAMETFKEKGILNLDANQSDDYGLVIYPR